MNNQVGLHPDDSTCTKIDRPLNTDTELNRHGKRIEISAVREAPVKFTKEFGGVAFALVSLSLSFSIVLNACTNLYCIHMNRGRGKDQLKCPRGVTAVT